MGNPVDNNQTCDKRNTDQTRDRLLLSGLQLLAAKGYRGAVTREIALNAGVTEMTLYRHFRSKDELFATAITQNGKMLLVLIPEPSGNMQADLLLLSKNIADIIISKHMLFVNIIPQIEDNIELREPVHNIRKQFRMKLISLIKHYRNQISIDIYTDVMIYYMFMGPIISYTLNPQKEGSAFNISQHVQFFLKGCGFNEQTELEDSF